MEDFSSRDEDWEDELPLATIRALDRVEPIIRAQGGVKTATMTATVTATVTATAQTT